MKVRSERDVAAVVPYLIGYHPQHSLVVLVTSHLQVSLVARTDLPATDDIAAVADAIAAAVHQSVPNQEHHAAVVYLLGYGAAGPVRPALVAVQAAILATGVDVWWPLRVTDGRIWADDDPDGPHGEPIGDSPELGAVAAFRGVAPLSDRATYIAQVEPAPAAFSPATAAAMHLPRQQVRRIAEASVDQATPDDRTEQLVHKALDEVGTTLIHRALQRATDGQSLDDDEAALLTLLLRAPRLRDIALIHPADIAEQYWTWLDLLRRGHPTEIGGVGALFAITAWRRGDEVLARAAANRVLAIEPDNSLAQLAVELVDRHVPPTVWSTVATKTMP